MKPTTYLSLTVFGLFKNHFAYQKFAAGGVIYTLDDLKKFWENPKNAEKVIYFAEETEDEKRNPVYVSASQSKKDYEDNQYWDMINFYEDLDKAIQEAKALAKNDKNGVYVNNLRVTRGYATGGKVDKEYYELARTLIDSEYENFASSPVEYIQSMGWNASDFKDIKGISFSVSDIESLAEILKRKKIKNAIDASEDNAVSDYLTNHIAEKILEFKK